MRIVPEARLITHSVAENSGIEIYTFLARYWRPIHAEVMTHRVFGRNARSSRAVPNKVLLREPIIEPLLYGVNKPGMQSGAELEGWRRALARTTWITLARINRVGVRVLNFAGLHKQWSNRPLEWFGCIDVQITTTDLNNWDTLRIHPAAAPEIQALACAMKEARVFSKPRILKPGEWHLPWINELERLDLPLDVQKRLSVARSARLSYKPFDGTDTVEAEFARYEKLVGSQPLHASPAEHQATPDTFTFEDGRHGKRVWDQPELHGNLRGWVQLRKTLTGEFIPG